MCTALTVRWETWARVVACLGTSSLGEPAGSSFVILVIMGPKGRRTAWVIAMRRERSVRWSISILLLLWGLRGVVVSVLLLGRGDLSWATGVVVVVVVVL